MQNPIAANQKILYRLNTTYMNQTLETSLIENYSKMILNDYLLPFDLRLEVLLFMAQYFKAGFHRVLVASACSPSTGEERWRTRRQGQPVAMGQVLVYVDKPSSGRQRSRFLPFRNLDCIDMYNTIPIWHEVEEGRRAVGGGREKVSG